MAAEQSSAQTLRTELSALDAPARPRERGGVRNFLVRLFKTRLAGVGMVIVVVFTLAALLAPVIAPYSPTKQQVTQALKPPSAEHWLGTDELGRDIYTRVLYGGQVSLKVGFTSILISMIVGVLLGMLAGYGGGRLDDIIMRGMDALLAFPQLVLAIALVAAFGVDKEDALFPKVIYAIAIVGIPAYARLTRGQVLTMREREFVQAARVIGASDRRIIWQHIFPNITAPLIVQSSLGIAGAMLAEAGLSFLGLGVQPPTPSWGSMLSAGRGYIEIDPWLLVGPGAAVFLAVLGFNFLGDGIRDVLDPRLRH